MQSNEPIAGRHAIIIGGSMAGLLAGRVLADHFDRVTIVDRDSFPKAPDHRKGVPQSHHAHALLPRGQMVIGQLFPGIMDELRTDGALSIHNMVSLVIVSPAGKLPAGRMPGEFMAFSRVLLEWHVRRRLAERPEVRFIANCEVVELLSTPGLTRVTGVRLHHRSGSAGPATLAADLVVDASGRNSKLPEWLERLGYAAPPEETVSSGLGYASRFYAKPADFPDEWQGIIINGRPPHNPRGGLILPIEHGRWHVTLGGFADNPPPTDEAGFMQWAHDLPDPSIYEAIRVAKPLSPIRGYGTPQNRLRHFERLVHWPGGLIATGDSVCAFNPIYGQGMTVSAMDALVLEACLRREHGSSQPGFEQRFQRELAQDLAAAWLVSSGEDLRWPGVTLSGARPRLSTGLLHRYMNLVLRQATEDPIVTQAYMGVIGMLAPPRALAQPRILARVLGGALRRAFGLGAARTNQPQFALSPEAIVGLRARSEARYAGD